MNLAVSTLTHLLTTAFSEQGKICSGDGQCAHGIWQVENDLERQLGPDDADNSVEFEMYARECNADDDDSYKKISYDMFGASPWYCPTKCLFFEKIALTLETSDICRERVDDILAAYGMCSYRNWFEYLDFFNPVEDPDNPRANLLNSKCGQRFKEVGCEPESFNAEEALWRETDRDQNLADMRSLWQTEKFRVKPHVCDREYAHLRHFKGCAPDVLDDNSAMGVIDMEELVPLRSKRGRIAQTFSRYKTAQNDTQIYYNVIGKDPFQDQPEWQNFRTYGFLSINRDKEFKLCSAETQCRVDDFTFNGVQLLLGVRSVVTSVAGDGDFSNRTAWNKNSQEECGIFGNLVDESLCGFSTSDESLSCCQIDRAVAPLYELFCNPGTFFFHESFQ